MKSALKQSRRTPETASGLRDIVRKTALLNLGVVLSALAFAVILGSPSAFLIIAFLVPIISVMLWAATFAISAFVGVMFWAATFAISAFVSLSRISWVQGVRGRRPRLEAGGGGVDDEWLDGPA